MKLKTFRDIQEEFKSDCVAKDFHESVLINKPLVGANAYYLDRLKQEAIKWIKFIDKGVIDLRPHNLTNYHEKITGLCATREWIVMFFNITEKDLK